MSGGFGARREDSSQCGTLILVRYGKAAWLEHVGKEVCVLTCCPVCLQVDTMVGYYMVAITLNANAVSHCISLINSNLPLLLALLPSIPPSLLSYSRPK